MTQPTDSAVTATVHVDAAAEVVYGLLTDLPTLASLAEETVAMEWRKEDPGGGGVRPGAVFTGHNASASRRWVWTDATARPCWS